MERSYKRIIKLKIWLSSARHRQIYIKQYSEKNAARMDFFHHFVNQPFPSKGCP